MPHTQRGYHRCLRGWGSTFGGRRRNHVHPVRPTRGQGQDVDLSTGHRRCRGSTCGYQAGIPIGILHLRQRERYTEICCLPMARHGAGTTHSRISGDNAHEWHRSHSSHPEGVEAEAPLVGARFLAPGRGGVAPTTRGSGIANDPTTPLGCRTDCLTGECDTLAGSCILMSDFLPGVFATSWLDTRS